jgi:hypothetical protein
VSSINRYRFIVNLVECRRGKLPVLGGSEYTLPYHLVLLSSYCLFFALLSDAYEQLTLDSHG